jgi:hypothetical protein
MSTNLHINVDQLTYQRRPTYISTPTNLHINADQLTYQRRPTYISTCKYSTNYHWRSKDNCLTQTVDSKAAAVLHTILRCSQVEIIPMGLVIPMTNMATFIQLSQTDHVFKQSCLFKSHFFFEFLQKHPGLVSCPFFMSFCFNVPYQLTLLHNLRPLTSQVNAMLLSALCFANLSFLIGIGYHSWFTPTFTGMQLGCKRKVGCSLKCTEIVDGVQLV